MEPFVAEHDQRIMNDKPIVGKGDGGKSNSLILIVLVIALLAMGGAMVAVVYSQKQSFDALQQNFQALQGKLPATEAPATAVVEEEVEAEVEPAPVVETPAVSPAPTESPDVAKLTAAISRLEQQISGLDSRISELDNKVANLPRSSGGGNNQALMQTTGRLSGEVATLRKEILAMKLSLNDTDGVSKDWQSEIGQRLNVAESELRSLRQRNREGDGDVSLADAVHQLQQEMIRLKRQQKRLHPYEKD